MRVVHDPERCQLHGQCTIAAPELFRFAADGRLEFEPEPDELWRLDAEGAADVCPERAIRIEG
mgnify:CR=1 FL=1